VYDVTVLPNDDIVVVGSEHNSSGNSDAWLRKYNTNGDIVWTRTHAGAANELDSARSVISDSSGNIYVSIREGQVTIENGVINIIRKYNTSGDELWSIFEPEGVFINDIAFLPSGSLLLAGQVGTNQYWTPLLQEMNSDGAIQWQEDRPQDAPGWYSELATNTAGDIVLAHVLQGENNARIVRLAANLQELWSGFPWGVNSGTQGVALDDLGWFVCNGSSGQEWTLWTRKYQPNGNIAWTDTYNGEEALLGIDQAEGIALDSRGNVISVGYVQDSEETGTDVWIRKLAP
jgi:hypothetical protein